MILGTAQFMKPGKNLKVKEIKMDEIITKDVKNDIHITTVMLSKKNDIKLLRGFELDGKKKYMRNYVIIIKNEFITSNISESVLLREELLLFDRGDGANQFCKINKRKVGEEFRISLKIELTNKKPIYISKSEAKSIVSIFNMALMGYSFSRLLEFENKQTLESWANALYKNKYLEFKG